MKEINEGEKMKKKKMKKINIIIMGLLFASRKMGNRHRSPFALSLQ
jgi:hypothetical protein